MTPAFQVNAPAVAVPQGLEIRDLQLSLSENGPAESNPVFESGAFVYTSFKVFGLQSQSNRTSARVSCKVLGPDGQVILDNPNFVDLSGAAYYRPATYWVPVFGQMTTTSGMKKGIYTEQYSVIDNVSNQTVTLEVKFELR